MKNLIWKASICLFYSSLINGVKYVKSDQLKSFYFINSVNVIPHPDKIDKGGEDAYYISDNIIAVADGVGGWSL